VECFGDNWKCEKKEGEEWKVCEELKGELYFFLNAEGNPGTKEKREATG